MRSIAAPLTALMLALCAACSSASSQAPPVQRSRTPSGTATGTPVRPAGGVTARWQPDMNWKHAHRVVTHGDAALARALRHDLSVAPDIPLGMMSCPIDVGTKVALVIRIGAHTRRATVDLSGCRAVLIPGHRARRTTPAIVRDLRTIAPPRWEPWLR